MREMPQAITPKVKYRLSKRYNVIEQIEIWIAFYVKHGIKSKYSKDWRQNRWNKLLLICWSLEGLIYTICCILSPQKPSKRPASFIDTGMIPRVYLQRQEEYMAVVNSIGDDLSVDQKFDVKKQYDPCNLVLPGMLRCEEQQCLWSSRLQKHIDMRFKPLHFTEGKSCLWPMGGQQDVLKSEDTDKISFLITFQRPIPILYQCILHVFLDSRYAPNAEIILVQDGPAEATRVKNLLQALALAFGFQSKYVQNKESLGFGASNNKGVEAATGNLIAIINSDALLHPGWSRSMLLTMHMYPKIALVGSQLIGDEDIITDAGGCVWSDGTPEIIGRWMKELPSHLSYMRPVDYSSAAAIMMRKDLGGFDLSYGRGYFEDTDIAFKLRKHGHQVVIQPMSLAYHQEGSTLGNEESEARKVLFENGMRIFQGKWGQEIQNLHCSVESRDIYSASHRHRNINILYLDSNLPEIDRDSGSIRQEFILQILTSMGVQVHFYPTENHHAKYLQRALFIGVNVLSADERYEVVFGKGPICKYNAIIVSHRDNYQRYKPQLKSSGCSSSVIFDTVDLHFLREARQYLSHKKLWNFNSNEDVEFVKRLVSSDDQFSAEEALLRKDATLELELLNEARVSLFASDVEVDIISRMSPNVRAYTVTNIYDISRKNFDQQSWYTRSGCIFIGNMNHIPNLEAIKVLLEEVLPEFRKLNYHASGFKIHIVGSNIIPNEMKKLMAKHKEIVRFYHNLDLDQLSQLYDSVIMSVAPLQSGAGVKGKIAEAVLMGVPIVGTPIALEAMHLTDQEEVLVASNPKEFAKNMHILMTNKVKWNDLRRKAWKTLQKYFSINVASRELSKALSELIPPELFNLTNPAC